MTTTPTQQVEQALRRNFLFASLADDEIGTLAQEVWLEEIPARSIIVRENDDADALYLVVKGGVNVTKADGRFLAYLGRDGFFGEMAIFTEGARRTATCETALDTTFAILRRDVLDAYCAKYPVAAAKIYKSIIRTMGDRLQATSADLAMLMSTQVQAQSGVDDVVEKAKKKRGR